VQKAGGEQTPPLVCAYGRGAEVAAPMEYVERRGLVEGDAASPAIQLSMLLRWSTPATNAVSFLPIFDTRVCSSSDIGSINCWIHRYAATQCNVIPPLTTSPMHNYHATHYTPISPRGMTLSGLPIQIESSTVKWKAERSGRPFALPPCISNLSGLRLTRLLGGRRAGGEHSALLAALRRSCTVVGSCRQTWHFG
jgi:hypothetical protein